MSVNSLIVRSLNHIRQIPELTRVAEAIDDLLKGHDNVAAQLATNPNGANVIPENIAQIQAKHLGNGLVDFSITDNSSVSRAIEYHVEYDTSPSFTNPRGLSLGPWRNGSVPMPNGIYYVRAYSQYPAGGPPSKPISAQGTVVVSNSATLPLLTSQGSGTGNPHAGGGFGSGKTITR